MSDDTGSKLYMTELGDFVEDRARTEGWPDGHIARVLEKAAMPEVTGDKYFPSQKIWNATAASVVNLALTAIKHEDDVANVPKPERPEQERLRKLAKAACGKSPTLAARGELLKELIAQGRTPREAQTELERIAKAFGADLHNLQPGRTPKEFKKPRDPLADDGDDDGNSGGGKSKSADTCKPSTGADAELEALADEAMTSLAAQGRLYKIDPLKCAMLLAERGLALGQLAQVKKPGTPDQRGNPWSAAGWNEKEQLRITKVNPKLAASLMLAVARKR